MRSRFLQPVLSSANPFALRRTLSMPFARARSGLAASPFFRTPEACAQRVCARDDGNSESKRE